MEGLIEAIGPGATTAFVLILVIGTAFVAWKLASMTSYLREVAKDIGEMKTEIKDIDTSNRADHGRLWTAFEGVRSDVHYLRGRAESRKENNNA